MARRSSCHARLVYEDRSFLNDDHDPYLGHAERRDLMFDTRRFDPRYHPKEWVVGLAINGIAKAYPFSELKNARPPISDQVGGRSLTIRFNRQSRSASVLDADGKPIPSIMAFWFAWYAFHLDTQVFKNSEQRSP